MAQLSAVYLHAMLPPGFSIGTAAIGKPHLTASGALKT